MRLSWIVLAVVWPVTDAVARGCAPDDVDQALGEASRLLDEGRAASAAGLHEQLAACEHALDTSRAARLSFDRGRVLAALGRTEEAIEHHRRALALDGAFSPSERARAQQEIDALLARLPGDLAIECALPDMTLVLLDAADEGDARLCPARWEGLAPGRHRIHVTLADGVGFKTTVVVRPAVIEQVMIDPMGRLTIEGDPAGAVVHLGEETIGILPLNAVRIPPGRHRVTVSVDGAAPVSRALVMKPGGEMTLRMSPIPLGASPARASTASRLAWLTTGIGVGALAGSAALLARADAGFDDAERARRQGQRATTLEAHQLASTRNRDALDEASANLDLGHVFLGAGLTLLLSGATLFVIDAFAPDDSPPLSISD